MFSLVTVHKSWREILMAAILHVGKDYLQELQNCVWLPGERKIFNAFSLPHDKVRFILFGESPYPRALSANGYAFWDNSVKEIFAENGFSKELNRATSLRNFVKMLLLANKILTKEDLSQIAIGKIDKANLVKTLSELFTNLLNTGFLLLNASLVYTKKKSVNYDAKMWLPFIDDILKSFPNPDNITLLLFGNVAKKIDSLKSSASFVKIYAEHPYNLSFITNEKVLSFFRKIGFDPLNIQRLL